MWLCRKRSCLWLQRSYYFSIQIIRNQKQVWLLWLLINFCNDQNEWTLNQIIFFKLPIVVWDLQQKSNIHLGRYQFSIVVGMIQYSRQRLEPTDFIDFDGKAFTENSWQAVVEKEGFWLISYWKTLNQVRRTFLWLIAKLNVWDWYSPSLKEFFLYLRLS